MTWVKICGITNLEDAQHAVEAGADALGFVFYARSSRNIAPERAREIVEKLPNTVETVGVFAGESVEKWREIVGKCGLKAAQLPAGSKIQPRVAKVYLVWSTAQLPEGGSTLNADCDAVFLDSSSREQPGGTGKTFDWPRVAQALKNLDGQIRFVVAGGLTVTNVAEAMRILRPWGVDVSSGVELRPGKKYPEKVRAFIAAVREMDRKGQ